MKIDKKNPSHWFSLIAFGLSVLVAWVLRWLPRSKDKPLVVLYGHKLNGNLLAIYQCWRLSAKNDFDFVFLTMDQRYCRKLTEEGFSSVCAVHPKAVRVLTQADAVVSDHGLHVLAFMVGKSSIKFFDVWHGIPFKGFDKEDFELQRRYDEVWVASEFMYHFYVERYEFDEERVQVTGYARTDRLVNQDKDLNAIRSDLGLDKAGMGKIILFAPTWAQDVRGRSVYPFGVDEKTFLKKLSDIAERWEATVVIRSHLNSSDTLGDFSDRVLKRSSSEFPDTESLLLVSDVLICDWSSIAFDWILLERPTIFLDVPAPFKKGFSLDSGYRFGCVVGDFQALLNCLQKCLSGVYFEKGEIDHHQAKLKKCVYGHFADGCASERCLERLKYHLINDESFE